MEKFNIIPVGVVRKGAGEDILEIFPRFRDAADGLHEGDFIKLILWFHKSDTLEKRRVLKVHPHGNPQNPLTGVFATRSPVRPNPLAIYTVRIHRIEEGRIYIDPIDAENGTPIADIKIFVESLDCPARRELEEWELDIENARHIGNINLIPRISEHLDELEEVSPEEFTALIVELGSRTIYLTAKDLADLIRFLNETYERLPVEIKDKLKSQSS
ncbi:tRNA (N6-threonylcarbamoyladenosine(37)-N6)-methyltransferase TrmO [Thermococcus barophilus]|uniref:TsaA-like domain-containing protein n=1 Tax=Thermococcus barophilus TaxID=55802 RepID=A0A0S1XB06_THEBA|nr:tRNA (N6-threonylcarbamoyladenosine(37)-N6)-methyltransferase TrmO [Thermococcus barophilus]ALM74923.1 hypothetical protein TBCH5v1_0978 [Thermococcus barophilus]